MEEAVCAVADGLVAVHTSGSDDADGRLRGLHHAALHATCVCTKDNVGVCLNKECILHVTRGVVFGEVHCREYVPVILNLYSVSNGESEAREDVYNFILYN